MGELSKSDAEKKCKEYIDHLNKLKRNIREDFTEMDFENANKRDEMETYIEGIEAEYEELISTLEDMAFEGGTE